MISIGITSIRKKATPSLAVGDENAADSIHTGTRVILASASRARRDILTRAGLSFTVETVSLDERGIREKFHSADADSSQASQTLAEAKARAVPECGLRTLVIGADQILECGGGWFGKPLDRDEARAQLKSLKGRGHTLVSSVCVVRGKRLVWSHTDKALLTMRNFSDDFLESYLREIDNGTLHSAGAYQLEGTGSQLFSSIEGDYFTILGLPLLPLLEFLRSDGVLKS